MQLKKLIINLNNSSSILYSVVLTLLVRLNENKGFNSTLEILHF